MVEGSSVSPMVPAEAGIAIPNAQNAIPSIQISSRFILLMSAGGQSREILNPPLRERSLCQVPCHLIGIICKKLVVCVQVIWAGRRPPHWLSDLLETGEIVAFPCAVEETDQVLRCLPSTARPTRRRDAESGASPTRASSPRP